MPANIQLNKQPPTISLLAEGLRYEVESKRDFSGVNAELILTMSQVAANYLDKSFTLSFMGVDIQFYFRLEPDQSGQELTTWLGADSWEVFATKMVDELNSNFFLNKDYTAGIIMQAPADRIIFQAKSEGPAYNISLKASDVDGVSSNTETPGIISSIPADYRIYYAPYIYGAANPLGRELLAIDADKKSEINLAAYLDNEIKTQFTYPFNGVYARTLPDAVKKYFIKYAEFEDDKTQVLRSTYDTPKYVIRGGLKRIDSDFFYNEDGNYFDYANNVQKFLNWAPSNKITYPDVPELLFFYKSIAGNHIVKLEMKKLGEAAVTSDLVTITAAAANIIELAVGLPNILSAENGTDVEWYKIWIVDATQQLVSEVRTYTVDQKIYLNKRVIFFQNSFDLYETICCTGVLKTDDSFKREEIEIKKGPVFRRKTKRVEQSQVYELSSGWLFGLEYRNWLTEVLHSKDTFLMLGHFLLPIIITNKKVKRSEDRENLYSINFQFEADFNENRYSSIVGDGAYFLLDENGIVLLDENNIGLIAS